MTRIVAGVAGGRRLQTPRGSMTRPTSERVREAVFAKLDGEVGLEGAYVLDLYAGSGALGLEAASRGADRVVLVESRGAVARLARANARRLVLTGVIIRAEAVERVLAGPPPDSPFHLVLADPPYDLPEDRLAGILTALVEPGWLAPDALVVVERSRRGVPPAWPPPLFGYADRTYGDTRVWYARVTDPGPEVGPDGGLVT